MKIGGNIGNTNFNLKIIKIIFNYRSFLFSTFTFKIYTPNYAILLNISNDHIDWHGSMKSYIQSKFKIFNLQTQKDHALINEKFKNIL